MSRVPLPVNDQNKTYLPDSPERAELKSRLSQMAAERIDIPLVIGGCEIRTSHTEQSVMPHNHRHVLADWHGAERGARAAGDRCSARGATRVGELVASGSRGGVPARSGTADDDVASNLKCRHDAGPVEDGDPGRDRFGVGADRLLAIQSALSRRSCPRSSRSAPTSCGTASSTGRSRASSTR